MIKELTFTYTYRLNIPGGEILEGGSHLELEIDDDSALSLVDAYAIAYEAVVEEIQHLLEPINQEQELTISIQKLLFSPA